MHRLLHLGLCGIALVLPWSASAASGKVKKVLPHFLDAQGRHSLSPSLFDRDAYQAWLRQHPESRSGMRFDVQWRVRSTGTNRVYEVILELRGLAQGELPRQKTLIQEARSGAGARWTGILLAGPDYRDVGEVTAWRVTLWDGEQLLDEQKSFLW